MAQVWGKSLSTILPHIQLSCVYTQVKNSEEVSPEDQTCWETTQETPTATKA